MDSIEYLYQSGFYIRAEIAEDAKEISVLYPEITIFNHKYSSQNIIYKMVETGIEIYGVNLPSKIIKCSEYANRMIIWALILRKCQDMKINPDLLIIIKKDGSTGKANELMTTLYSPKNRKKESILVKLFLSYLAGEEMREEAVKVGVPQSYKTLKKILNGED